MSFTLLVPTVGRVTSPFGNRRHPVTGQPLSFHKGIDIAQAGRHDVVAAANGKVFMTVTNPNHWGYGLTVVIRHSGYDTLYAHLDTVDVRVGQDVRAGQRLGLQGNTGTSTGQHLHFEVHIPRYESFQPHVKDPMSYISWPSVVNLQKLLNRVGYNLTADGISGQKTDAAVRDFQSKNRLTVDGVAGNKTLSALNQAVATQQNKEITHVSSTQPINPNLSDIETKNEEGEKMYRPSARAMLNDTATVLRRLENKGDQSIDPKWRQQLLAGELTESDALGILFVALQRGLIQGEK